MNRSVLAAHFFYVKIYRDTDQTLSHVSDLTLANELPDSLTSSTEGMSCVQKSDRSRIVNADICHYSGYVCGYASGYGGTPFIVDGKTYTDAHGKFQHFKDFEAIGSPQELATSLRSWVESEISPDQGRGFDYQYDLGLSAGMAADPSMHRKKTF
jgi:hypothetical protein